LLGVRKGTFWVPRYKEVRLEPCPNPPKKSLLFKAITDHIAQLPAPRPKLGLKDHTVVDKDWLIKVLSTLNQNHRYFAKDYRPTAAELREEDAQEPQLEVANDDGFFDGLPDLGGKKKKGRRGRDIFISKQQKEEVKFKKLEHRASLIHQKIQAFKAEEEEEEAEPIIIQIHPREEQIKPKWSNIE